MFLVPLVSVFVLKKFLLILVDSRSQGLTFLPKTECNVRDVEIAVGLMLTKTSVEPVAFRVPRVKVSQYYPLQDSCKYCISPVKIT